jgi:hypothetical protein
MSQFEALVKAEVAKLADRIAAEFLAEGRMQMADHGRSEQAYCDERWWVEDFCVAAAAALARARAEQDGIDLACSDLKVQYDALFSALVRDYD